MCHSNGLLFHQNALDMGPILVKILKSGSYFTNIETKIVKSAIFELGTPLDMGPNFAFFYLLREENA